MDVLPRLKGLWRRRGARAFLSEQLRDFERLDVENIDNFWSNAAVL
jgi:hypothetical protein